MTKLNSLKVKISLLVDAILVVTVAIVAFSSFKLASDNMLNSIKKDLTDVANGVSKSVFDINEKELFMLESLASLSVYRNPDIPTLDKCKELMAVSMQDRQKYENVAFYDKDGISYRPDGVPFNSKGVFYFDAAISGKRYVSEPIYSEEDKKSLMFYAVPVYDINDGKTIIGIISSIINGNALETIVKDIDIGFGFHPAIIQMSTGRTIADANEVSKKAGDSVGQLDPNSGLAKVIKIMMTGATGTYEFQDPFTKQRMVSSYKPVGGECDWTVFCASPYEVYFGSMKAMRNFIIIIFIILFIVSSFVAYYFISKLISPLSVLRDSILDIASGNADLTKRIEVKSDDEIGEVVSGFNKFTEKLQMIVSDIKSSRHDLSVADESFLQTTKNTAVSIADILSNIDDVKNNIDNQAKSVEQTAGAVNEIASNIDSFGNMIENQVSCVSEASTAVEQMMGNISSVNHSVEKMSESFSALQDKAAEGALKQKSVNERITEIEKQSEMLQQANKAIASIASQTNLLAMNAAIEAAHAGDAGKGFSVVSDEIRKLSETSAAQSKTIGNQLKNIKDSILTVVDASRETSIAFQTVSEKIGETDELVKLIKSAMDEQIEGSKQITDSLHSMNNSTSEVKVASNEMSEGNKAILSEVRALQETSYAIRNSMSIMTDSARKIDESGNALNDISGKMSNAIEKISLQIDKFNV